ncbi:6-carboxytetrahydropterin synthase QueD [Criblamydia sequanensis]|uniref:6-carboxy-5,6,7,8-tetrahydropterin synthase n=1 Tax=Candidatus Criblamydia sequanensis CRIB-18 TaxID=1437425 RepID=A0A090D135_9BACT|nr:6-carboxytetrahydropterin synthase QueD [Criblamydia sequanensis]CDR35081.1 6-carboxy-5,6,7,8-tetrahydropterin synthase [Criblamydia sequanensis CRIB-18]
MFELEKSFRFEAGHSLPQSNSKCRVPHGHSFLLVVKIRAEKLQEEGQERNMVVDFNVISSVVRPLINEYFDHCWLNDTLQTDAPTVEFIARWIYNRLKPELPDLYSITLHETDTQKVTFYES